MKRNSNLIEKKVELYEIMFRVFSTHYAKYPVL
jgi:hypothetical protein